MSLNDPLASTLSSINNHEKIGKTVCVVANSKLAKEVLKVMQEQHYLGAAEPDETGRTLQVHLLGRVNACGVIKPRFSVATDQFEKFERRFLPARQVGTLIMSTSQGVMTNQDAKKKGIGGKLLAYCY